MAQGTVVLGHYHSLPMLSLLLLYTLIGISESNVRVGFTKKHKSKGCRQVAEGTVVLGHRHSLSTFILLLLYPLLGISKSKVIYDILGHYRPPFLQRVSGHKRYELSEVILQS